MDWKHIDRGYVEEWRADVGEGLFLRVLSGTFAMKPTMRGGIGNDKGGWITLVMLDAATPVEVVQWQLIEAVRRLGATVGGQEVQA